MTWWIWVLAGLGLCIAELLTPGGFYLLFFGVGAVGVGVLDRFGWIGAPWLEWFLFTLFSVGALLFFRQPLRERLQEADPDRPIDDMINETAVALEDIAVDAMGKVELRGVPWSARNSGSTPIERGRRCQVERTEGVTLWVFSAPEGGKDRNET